MEVKPIIVVHPDASTNEIKKTLQAAGYAVVESESPNDPHPHAIEVNGVVYTKRDIVTTIIEGYERTFAKTTAPSERAQRAAEQARQILDEGRDPREVLSEADGLRRLLREVAVSGVEDDDKRLDYVTVQIDRVTWDAVWRSAMKGGKDA